MNITRRFSVAVIMIAFLSLSASAQRQTTLYIDNGGGIFTKLVAPGTGGTLTFPSGTGIIEMSAPGSSGIGVSYNGTVAQSSATITGSNYLFDISYAPTAADFNVLGALISSTNTSAGVNHSATGLTVNATATASGTATGLQLTTSGGASNLDINGSSGNWFITNAGAGTFIGVAAGTGAITGTGGATISGASNLIGIQEGSTLVTNQIGIVGTLANPNPTGNVSNTIGTGNWSSSGTITNTIGGTSGTSTSPITNNIGESGGGAVTVTTNIGRATNGASTVTSVNIGGGAATGTTTVNINSSNTNANATTVIGNTGGTTSITGSNWSVTNGGGATFTTLSSTGNSTIGTTDGTTNTFGTGGGATTNHFGDNPSATAGTVNTFGNTQGNGSGVSNKFGDNTENGGTPGVTNDFGSDIFGNAAVANTFGSKVAGGGTVTNTIGGNTTSTSIASTGWNVTSAGAGTFASLTDNGTLAVTGTSHLSGNVGIGIAPDANVLDVEGATSINTLTVASTSIGSIAATVGIVSSGWSVTPAGAGAFTTLSANASPVSGTAVFNVTNNSALAQNWGEQVTLSGNGSVNRGITFNVTGAVGNNNFDLFGTGANWYISSAGVVSAVSFSGAGTGLTGTASSLNIGGNAGSATTAATASNALELESATWESPGTIGSTGPNTGAFTTLSANASPASGTAVFNVTNNSALAQNWGEQVTLSGNGSVNRGITFNVTGAVGNNNFDLVGTGANWAIAASGNLSTSGSLTSTSTSGITTGSASNAGELLIADGAGNYATINAPNAANAPVFNLPAEIGAGPYTLAITGGSGFIANQYGGTAQTADINIVDTKTTASGNGSIATITNTGNAAGSTAIELTLSDAGSATTVTDPHIGLQFNVNQGSGSSDINGTGNNWNVDNNGDGTFQTLISGQSLSAGGGAFQVDASGNLSTTGDISTGSHVIASSIGTAADGGTGVTVTDKSVFIITGVGGGAITMPVLSVTGDVIVVINNSTGTETYAGIVTVTINSGNSRTFYWDGSKWQ